MFKSTTISRQRKGALAILNANPLFKQSINELSKQDVCNLYELNEAEYDYCFNHHVTKLSRNILQRVDQELSFAEWKEDKQHTLSSSKETSGHISI